MEYKSTQVFRIRVKGTKRSILLETNMPLIRLAESKKGPVWKLREGSFDNGDADTAHLLSHIIESLENLLERDFKTLFPERYPFGF